MGVKCRGGEFVEEDFEGEIFGGEKVVIFRNFGAREVI